MSEWISFNKRLPEEWQSILVISDEGAINLRKFNRDKFEGMPAYWRPIYWKPFEVQDEQVD